ncbi:urease accessory protein UreF [uncultured Hoeflea sp.]|uniref:urease accessory protein UreF n=1 Tax=uncultured Hoeflea sp. TaxID=538666 RepID=UPI0030EEC29F|tara:strand:+ start:61048 stop:61707 length:660 start_codon:yes stop_codon:yes gene_type:complete
MTSATQLLKLMSWLSPVFPIGGFAYSAGLEQAVQSGHVEDQTSLAGWIRVQITQGAQWNDAVLLAEAHRSLADKPKLEELTDLCLALCVGQQRLDETRGQGTSFIQAVSHWVGPEHFPDRNTPLPVAIGIAAAVEGLDIRLTAGAYLHAFVSNQLQCAIRLSVTGQDGAAKILAGLEPVVETTADRAAASTLEDLGAAAFIADIASMNHETLEPRLFLS